MKCSAVQRKQCGGGWVVSNHQGGGPGVHLENVQQPPLPRRLDAHVAVLGHLQQRRHRRPGRSRRAQAVGARFGDGFEGAGAGGAQLGGVVAAHLAAQCEAGEGVKVGEGKKLGSFGK